MKKHDYVFGRHALIELFRQGSPRVVHLYCSRAVDELDQDLRRMANHAKVPVTSVPKKQLENLVGPTANHQGLVAATETFEYASFASMLANAGANATPPLLVALDQVQDPANLGAILRSAAAFGADGLILPKSRSCEVTPAVSRISSGAAFRVPVAQVTNLRRALDELKSAGLWLVATDSEASTPIWEVDLAGPSAIVVGSEGRGIRRLTVEACDFRVAMPMARSVESLNAAAAATAALYEATRQRRVSGQAKYRKG